MRAALRGDRIPMMELLVSRGADVNATWNGYFPIIFAPCESVHPDSLRWLLDHGADPNRDETRQRYPGTALDYLLGTYARSPRMGECIDLLLQAGGRTRYALHGVLDVIRGRLDELNAQLDADPELVNRRFPELDCGSTGGRRLTLRGGTLLHVAAEYGVLEAAELLLRRGADVNARATIAEDGVGGQTPIFHAVSQFRDGGLPLVRVLLGSGADLTVRAVLPGHYEREDKIVECTPLGYALRFPEGEDSRETLTLLKARGAKD